MTVDITLKSENARVPNKKNKAPVYNIYTNEEITIDANEFRTIETNINFRLPFPEAVAIIFPCKNLSAKGIALLNAAELITIDDRNDTLNLFIINHSKTPYTIKTGDTIACLAVTNIDDSALKLIR